MEIRTTSYHLMFLAARAAPGYYYASKPLVSANGNGDNFSNSRLRSEGSIGNYYTQARFLAMSNGDGERDTLPGPHQLWY